MKMSRKIKVKGKKLTKEEKKDKKNKNKVEPIKKNRVLTIILCENKSTLWKWVSYRKPKFRVNENTYFLEPSGMYLSTNNVLCSIYVEGVSIPISHKYIERKMEIVKIVNPETKKEEETAIPVINNIKFDSEVIDILLNRNLADEFTKVKLDGRGLATIILILITLGVSIGTLAMNFVG